MSSRSRTRKRIAVSHRPCLEPLEPRELLSSVGSAKAVVLKTAAVLHVAEPGDAEPARKQVVSYGAIRPDPSILPKLTAAPGSSPQFVSALRQNLQQIQATLEAHPQSAISNLLILSAAQPMHLRLELQA